ncbi:MAG TPA: hypothetical protein VEM58_14275 [Streptosporangiaceae bacterium]|nr:hypothetical protein [Streptosporangiaceae bacterium]
MLIAIVNQSSLVSNSDAAAMTQAIAGQVRLDAAPLWDRAHAAVVFYTDASAIPPNAHVITITDTVKDQPAGVLGFHTEDQGGKLWGVVAAQPELSNGGQVTTGDWSVASVLSHEVLEMFVDPNCNLWSNNGKGSIYTFEVCDPVEAPTYAFDGVSVSNFVTPAWFDPLAGPGAQFDKLGLLTAPFGILKGGYVVYATAGKRQQKFGAEFPHWRRDMKRGPFARTSRRLAQAAALGDG